MNAQTETKMPTHAEFQTWAKENLRLAEAVFLAQAHAELTREKVDAYTLPIYESFGFVYEGTMAERMYGPTAFRGSTDNRLGQPLPMKDFYLLHGKDESEALQARIKEYYAAIHQAHIDNGYVEISAMEVGFCPAAIAETMHTEAENALLESGCALLGLRHVPFGDNREKMLKLLQGACMASTNETTSQQVRKVMRRVSPRRARRS